MTKEVVMIKKINGRKTLDMKVKELRKCGKLISQIRDPFDGGIKSYYSLEEKIGLDTVVEVHEVDGKVIAINNKPAEIIKTLPPIDVPMFGGF